MGIDFLTEQVVGATCFLSMRPCIGEDDGILVIPTVADPPVKLNSKKGFPAEFLDRTHTLLSIANMSGGCQVAIPFGKHDDSPISVSFIASYGTDKFLLDAVLDMHSSLQEEVSAISSSSVLPDTNGNLDAAEILKEKGNAAYKGMQWNKAVSYYTEAIKLNEANATYYSNRAAAYLQLGCFQQAEEDCSKAISLDKKFYIPEISCIPFELDRGIPLEYKVILSPNNWSDLPFSRVPPALMEGRINNGEARQVKDHQRSFETTQNTMTNTLSTILKTLQDLKLEIRQSREHRSPTSVPVTLPLFTGADPIGWVQQTELYFDLNGTREEFKLPLAQARMKDGPLHWFYQLRRSQPLLTWPDFKRELIVRYGGRHHLNTFEELATVRQSGSVDDFPSEFKVLSCLAPSPSKCMTTIFSLGEMGVNLAADANVMDVVEVKEEEHGKDGEVGSDISEVVDASDVKITPEGDAVVAALKDVVVVVGEAVDSGEDKLDEKETYVALENSEVVVIVGDEVGGPCLNFQQQPPTPKPPPWPPPVGVLATFVVCVCLLHG